MSTRRPTSEKSSAAVGASSKPSTRSAPGVLPDPKAVAAEFLAELERAIGPLQRSLESLLTLMVGTLKSPTELARDLSIPKMLAWRMWRLAHARVPAEAASFVTGDTALNSFLAASTRRGALAAWTDAVRQAHRDYCDFVQRTACDEATLKLMVAAVAGGDRQADAAVVRSAFDADRLRVGVQMTSQLICFVLFPGELEEIASAARIIALGECWWLRPDAQAAMRAGRLSHTELANDLDASIVHLSTSLDPQSPISQDPDADSLLSILPAFCHGDSTAVVRERIAGSMIHSIVPLRMGLNHASTICFGSVKHNCFLPLKTDPQTIFAVDVMLPAEQLVVEVYVHRELVRQGFVFRPMINDGLFRPLETPFWGLPIDLAALGGALQVIEPTEAIDSPVKSPPYRELMEFTFDRIGHVRRDFSCFRLRLPTPPLGIRAGLIAGQDLEPCPKERIH